jgi:Protein of unknown function (DUF3568)
MKKIVIFYFLFLFFFTGCSAAPMLISPIITGVIMWKDGEARKYYNEESHVLYRASKNSLKELDYPIIKDEKQKSEGYYIVAGNNDKFKIVIRQIRPHITEVKIRVNFMGDKTYAELIYKQIDLNTNTIEFDDQGKPTKNKEKRILR